MRVLLNLEEKVAVVNYAGVIQSNFLNWMDFILVFLLK